MGKENMSITTSISHSQINNTYSEESCDDDQMVKKSYIWMCNTQVLGL